jgi:thiamine transport system ATP-binding protein
LVAEPLLQLRNVGTRRGGFALAGVELALHAGQCAAVLGPSGCGKSTLLEIITGLERSYEGEIRFNGRDARRLAPAQRNLAAQMQELGLWERFSARKNVALCAQGDPDHWLDQMGFSARRDMAVASLSGGERQRVALARALSRRAELTLLDEPGAHLDRQSALRLAEVARESVAERNGALIVASHRLDDVLRFAPDWLLILQIGHCVRSAPSAEAISDPRNSYVASLLGYETIVDVATGERLGAPRPEITRNEPSIALCAWRFAQIRESAQGPLAATVLALLYGEFGVCARIELETGERVLIPATAKTEVNARIRVVADTPVFLRA